jgi:uncharacterized membrane protein
MVMPTTPTPTGAALVCVSATQVRVVHAPVSP